MWHLSLLKGSRILTCLFARLSLGTFSQFNLSFYMKVGQGKTYYHVKTKATVAWSYAGLSHNSLPAPANFFLFLVKTQRLEPGNEAGEPCLMRMKSVKS